MTMLTQNDLTVNSLFQPVQKGKEQQLACTR